MLTRAPERTLIQIFLLLFVIVLIAGAITQTGCGPSAQQKTLRVSLTTVNAARDGFITWDDQHQQGIVEKATSLEQGKQALVDYRAKRERVVLGFEVVYKTIALAALDPTAANVAAALAAITEMTGLLKELRDGSAPEPVLEPVLEPVPEPVTVP